MTDTEILTLRNAIFGPELAAYTLLLFLCAAFAGMMRGAKNGRPIETVRVYRKAGLEVLIIYLPFVLYAVLSGFKGTFIDLLASAELPMAGAIVSATSASRAYKQLKVNEGVYDAYKFQSLTVMGVAICVGCVFLASWITLQDSVSPWIGVSNLIIALVVTILSFSVIASMKHIEKNLP